MQKRILSMLLVLVMLLSMVPFQALAEDVTEPEVIVESNSEDTGTEGEESKGTGTEGEESKGTGTEGEESKGTGTEGEESKGTGTEGEESKGTGTEGEESKGTGTEGEESKGTGTEGEESKGTGTEGEESKDADTEGNKPEEPVVAAESVTISQEDELDAVPLGDKLQLVAVVLPENATDKTVVWTSSDETIATVDENGLLTGIALGDVTITAACGEVTDTYDVAVVEPPMTLEGEEDQEVLGDPDEEPPEDPDAVSMKESDSNPDELKVLAGEKLALEVELENAPADAVVIWYLPDYTDNQFATVSGDSSKVTRGYISARPDIYAAQEVTVRAELKGDSEVYVDFAVTLIPKVHEITLKADDADIPKDGYLFNLNDNTLVESGVRLSASVMPEEADGAVKWSVSGTDGLWEEELDSAGDLVIKPGNGKTGSITVTATAKDGSGKYAKAVIRFSRLAATLKITNAPTSMRAGSSVTLTTTAATEKGLSDRTVLWSLKNEDDAQYATIGETTGKLTAKKVDDAAHSITVYAYAKAYPAAEDEATITIYPATESIRIFQVDGEDNEIANTPVVFTNGGTVKLGKAVLPAAVEDNVTWSSSNTKIATVDADGVVTLKEAGKVIITCMANDGSKVKGTLYLEITKPAKFVTIEEHDVDLISGKSRNLKATVWTAYDEANPENNVLAANQKVKWSIGELDAASNLVKTSAASISSAGRVSAKSVKINTPVTVVAKSAEDGEVLAQTELIIMPAKEKSLLLYLDDAETPLGSSVKLCAGEQYRLVGKSYTRTDGVATEITEECTFLSDNTKVAKVSSDGYLTAKASGSAVITVRWKDEADSNRMYTAQVTVKVSNLVRNVVLSKPKSSYLRSGSSVTLKATAWTNREKDIKASNQKLDWKVFELDEYGDEQSTKIATISSSGKLTAKTVTETKQVRVYAISQENGVLDYVDLWIRPKSAYQLSLSYIFSDTTQKTGTVTVPKNLESIDGLTVTLYNSSDKDPSVDAAEVDPAGVVWSTSNKKIVAIEDGRPVFKSGTGKVTLTAKCTIGKSTASAKITLNVVNAVESIKINTKVPNQKLYFGKYLYMMALCNTEEDQPAATNKNVIWSFADDDSKEFATIDSRTGKVTAKKGFTEKQTVKITAVAADGYDAEAETPCELDIYPLATKVTISLNSEVVEKKETLALEEGTANLTVDLGLEDCPNEVKWYSSRTSVAAVDKDGNLTLKSKGTATIRATTVDGSGKSASFTLVVE